MMSLDKTIFSVFYSILFIFLVSVYISKRDFYLHVAVICEIKIEFVYTKKHF